MVKGQRHLEVFTAAVYHIVLLNWENNQLYIQLLYHTIVFVKIIKENSTITSAIM